MLPLALISVVIIIVGLSSFAFIRYRSKRYANECSSIEMEMNIADSQKHMKDIALNHKQILHIRGNRRLENLLEYNWNCLKKNYKHLIKVPEKIIQLVPSAQWLVDNYYMVEREVKFLRHALKQSYYKELPLLNNTQGREFQRIYVVAREVLNCTGYHVDEESIINLLNAYQSVTPLTVDELWAFIDMLKICIVEKINKISVDVIESVKVKNIADNLMEEALNTYGENDGEKLVDIFEKNFVDSNMTIKPAFITHVLYCLKELTIDDEILKKWFVERLNKNEQDFSSIIKSEGQTQSKLQICIGSLITTLREISGINYEQVFKSISNIEKILNDDPIGKYDIMSFETKMEYHRKIQNIAKQTNVFEYEVANNILKLAKNSYKNNNNDKKAHVGYYLFKDGLKSLYNQLNYKFTLFESFENAVRKISGVWYFGFISIITLVICILSVAYTNARVGQERTLLLAIAAIVTFIPAMTIAVEIVNFFSTRIVKPKKLLSLEFKQGIPDEYKTIVVMPVVIGSIDQVNKYIQRLEMYYLGNKDKNICFGILGDCKDGDSKDLEDDEQIINSAVEGINKLNSKYATDSQIFHLFIRQRSWNEKQGCWMGWERKRGILEQFNKLLIGEDEGNFTKVVGDKEGITKFKYVITIDAGTELVRDSGKNLIGIMAHPLNAPVLNKQQTLVVDGYTIIQPKVGIRIASSLMTYFSKLFSGQAGIDTYSLCVSDVYQDVFEKATFGGKGIYDPRVFHKVMNKAIPTDSILSHDLLECCYVQCGFASNVELMDDFPSNLASYFTREHRWIRGDWQLLPWLFGNNPLSLLSRYKIADNLRRSLIPLSYVLLIFLAVSLLSWQFYVWGTIILFTTIYPLLINVSKTTILAFNKHSNGFNILSNLNAILLTFIQGIIWFMILPYRAYISIDAIIRTLYRLYISKRKMLEWKTAEAAERTLKNDLKSYFKRMWISVVTAVALILISNEYSFPYSLIIGLLWIISPALSYYIGQNINYEKVTLEQEEINDLRVIARKTWRFFDDFFTPSDNYLTPDNYQEWPENGIAHRTSTTNIGLELLCILSAYDFGYITLTDMLDKIEKVFTTLSKLEKWNGHFYNWYDTRTLEPLLPRYVSTVDSGNFLGSLIALKNGLEEVLKKPILNKSMYSGFLDTLRTIQLKLDLHEPNNLSQWVSLIEILRSSFGQIIESDWAEALKKVCNQIENDIKIFKLNEENHKFSINDFIKLGNTKAEEIKNQIENIAKQIDNLVLTIDFKPLYDEHRDLFRIGYNVTTNTPDNSYYDLLASEARLASFIAIAKGDIPQKNWFRLGRTLTIIKGLPTLVSWSGTMFEYLMPNLLMKLVPKSLIQQTSIGAVKQQIEYGKRKGTPWGMSEAAYYRFDQHLNYQYRAIGVPGLGFSTDLGRFLVIAPYATILAINILPKDAYKNIQYLRQVGAEGRYGFYEAVDYITSKSDNYRKQNVVKSFFAHHQGMSLVALSNFINDNAMQQRFHKEAIIKATELVLEEKKPSYVIIRDKQDDIVPNNTQKKIRKPVVQRVVRFTKPTYPIAHILSNNQYTSMITSDGSGLSWYKDIVINRWRPDITCDSNGFFVYIKNRDTQKYWSSTFQPTCYEPDSYEAIFMLDKAEFKRKDGEIITKTEVTISPQDNVEIRKVTITNTGQKNINLEVSSYAEVVIDNYNSDLSHSSFNKLFVETEYVSEKHTILATRRPREKQHERKWLMHTMLVDGKPPVDAEYETDRSKFIGRGNSLKNPEAITGGLNLSNTVGKVLDSILSIRTHITLEPGKSRVVTYIIGIENTRQNALALADNYTKPHAVEDAFKMSLFNSELEMQYLDITPQQASSIQDIVGSIYYPSMLMRGSKDYINQNKCTQQSLWRFGLSGDYPIILLRIKDISEIEVVRDIILAYEYLKMKGVKADLVVLNEQNEGYFQDLSNKIRDMISSIRVFEADVKNSGAFLLQANYMSKEEITLLMTVARIVLTGSNRLLSKRIRNIMLEQVQEESSAYKFDKNIVKYEDLSLPEEDLEYFNGIGGFTKDGKEYVIKLKNRANTPAPWINVIANEKFGFNISATGSGYTWAINSRENKITKWSNDPVIDQPSEVIYIRDEETGSSSTPTPSPIRDESQYNIRHGFGYSTFNHNSLGIVQEMTVFAAKEDPVKFYKVKLINKTNAKRNISLLYFAELILGVVKDQTAPYIITERDTALDIMTAKNTYNSDFPNHIAFAFSTEPISSFTADRSTFLGKCGCLEKPYALTQRELMNISGAGLDPCFALKVNIELQPEQQKEVVFVLGQTDNYESISEFVQKYRNINNVSNELDNVKKYWSNILETIKVQTPDLSFNNMLNGWLLYQTLGCRIMARSAFYQASGAFGFRDQLQDVLALLNVAPEITRKMILQHSSRQFLEGDVQHWWHTGSGKGVRTKTSDDLLWLPYVTSAYITSTGDTEILDESVPYLSDKELEPEEHDRYSIPNVSTINGNIYEHCIKAIDRALRFGSHGLPLMGSGDWNDGMSKVGAQGRGESVWLGWFIIDVLNKFIPICIQKGDKEKSDSYQQIAQDILKSIEENAWDGEWYLRAYFDNGMPLGSKQNTECKIDSIAQSWSVIAQSTPTERSVTAMNSVLRYLVNDENQIVLLLSPPFDKSEPDPGYIRGYIAGIRENGGQYTHAAVWNILAFAKLRNGDTAYRLFKMLNPVNHTLTYTDLMKYKNEPYVMSADVYSTTPHGGRGGWSWYTGASGWMYQAGIQWILGLNKNDDIITIDPTIPKEWPEYTIEYLYKSTNYVITVQNPNGVNSGVSDTFIDGVKADANKIKLIDDGITHYIAVKLG